MAASKGVIFVSTPLCPKSNREWDVNKQHLPLHSQFQQCSSTCGERFYWRDILHDSFFIPFASCPAHLYTKNDDHLEGVFGAAKMDFFSSAQSLMVEQQSEASGGLPFNRLCIFWIGQDLEMCFAFGAVHFHGDGKWLHSHPGGSVSRELVLRGFPGCGRVC